MKTGATSLLLAIYLPGHDRFPFCGANGVHWPWRRISGSQHLSAPAVTHTPSSVWLQLQLRGQRRHDQTHLRSEES
jgi:hypothetical protein